MKCHTLTDACCPEIYQQIQAIQILAGSVFGENNKRVLSFQSTEFNPVTFKNAMQAAL